jgi:hypothetical protein
VTLPVNGGEHVKIAMVSEYVSPLAAPGEARTWASSLGRWTVARTIKLPAGATIRCEQDSHRPGLA